MSHLTDLKGKDQGLARVTCTEVMGSQKIMGVQNRVGELYSLIRFLRIYPYAFYFCGAGTAKSSKEAPCTCSISDSR